MEVRRSGLWAPDDNRTKLKEEMTHIKELCKHMDMEINGSDLMKKTDYIFAVTDSSIVEAKTVTIECVFLL